MGLTAPTTHHITVVGLFQSETWWSTVQLAASIIVIRTTPGSPYFSFTIYVPHPDICQSAHLVGPGLCAAGAWSGLSLRTEDALDAGPDALSARAHVVASNLPPQRRKQWQRECKGWLGWYKQETFTMCVRCAAAGSRVSLPRA